MSSRRRCISTGSAAADTVRRGTRGYDAGKKVAGRKRYTLIDREIERAFASFRDAAARPVPSHRARIPSPAPWPESWTPSVSRGRF